MIAVILTKQVAWSVERAAGLLDLGDHDGRIAAVPGSTGVAGCARLDVAIHDAEQTAGVQALVQLRQHGENDRCLIAAFLDGSAASTATTTAAITHGAVFEAEIKSPAADAAGLISLFHQKR